ncbi:MAG: hypothetical protein WC716_13670 [Chitinophagaceae bacterium]|jgi:hypothetical protein
MNGDEWEQWMKDSLGKQEFEPTESSWNKFCADRLTGKKQKKRLIYLLPKRLKIAVSVVLCTTIGGSAYYMYKVKGSKANGNPLAVAHSVPLFPVAKNKTTASAAPAQHATVLNTKRPCVKMKKNTGIDYWAQTNDTAIHRIISHSGIEKADSLAFNQNGGSPSITTVQSDAYLDIPLLDEGEKKESSFKMGIATQLGKANVGSIYYQVGLVAHQNLSGSLYAEATVALASTAVSYVQTNSFPALTANSGTFNTATRKSVDAQYGNNIFSVGFTPAIGYRITPKLAISSGISLYRNLNPSVSLKQPEGIDSALLNNHLLPETQALSNWDIGLAGNVKYTISNRLGLSFQYRQGLSTFMYFNGQAVRNSGFNMGLNYLFGE